MWIWMWERASRTFNPFTTNRSLVAYCRHCGINVYWARVKPQGTKKRVYMRVDNQKKRPFCLKVFAVELQKKFCFLFDLHLSHSPLSAINVFNNVTSFTWTNKEIIFELLVRVTGQKRRFWIHSFIMRKLSHSLIMISSLFFLHPLSREQQTATYAHFFIAAYWFTFSFIPSSSSFLCSLAFLFFFFYLLMKGKRLRNQIEHE